MIIVPGNPVGKPRMTRSDKWKKRPCVVRYRAWADAARLAAGVEKKQTLTTATALNFRAYFSIPKSWSRKARELAKGRPHLRKADSDNIMKSICDALFANDEYVCAGSFLKYWDDGKGARVEIEIREVP